MQEMERIEDLKMRMRRKVNNKEAMPEEVIQTIQEGFKELLNIYKDLQCDNSSIQQYIEGNLRQLKADVTKNLGEKRRASQLDQVQDICGMIERELENPDIQKGTGKEEMHKQEIMQIESGEQHISTRIMTELEDSLRNVQSVQNRILNSHGYSMEKMEQVNQNVRGFIRYFVSRNEGKIYSILNKDNNALKEQLLTEYEEYLAQNKQDKARSEEEKIKNEEDREENDTEEKAGETSKRAEFIGELDGNISLEEQRKFSQNYMDEVESKSDNEKRSRRFTRQYFGIRRNYGRLYI